jgi:hypothetical protein
MPYVVIVGNKFSLKNIPCKYQPNFFNLWNEPEAGLPFVQVAIIDSLNQGSSGSPACASII